MKSNIVCENTEFSSLKWWTWIEVCDNCNKVIFTNEDRRCSKCPDTKEQDYCLDCMREIFKIKENK